jgi:hypothetical protein
MFEDGVRVRSWLQDCLGQEDERGRVSAPTVGTRLTGQFLLLGSVFALFQPVRPSVLLLLVLRQVSY